MSFHEDSFHETKRERKKYEDKKQKALKYIDTIESETDGQFVDTYENQQFEYKLMKLRDLVIDI